MSNIFDPCFDCGQNIDNNGGIACICSKCYGQLQAIGSAADQLSLAFTQYLTRMDKDDFGELWIRITLANNAYRQLRGMKQSLKPGGK